MYNECDDTDSVGNRMVPDEVARARALQLASDSSQAWERAAHVGSEVGKAEAAAAQRLADGMLGAWDTIDLQRRQEQRLRSLSLSLDAKEARLLRLASEIDARLTEARGAEGRAAAMERGDLPVAIIQTAAQVVAALALVGIAIALMG